MISVTLIIVFTVMESRIRPSVPNRIINDINFNNKTSNNKNDNNSNSNNNDNNNNNTRISNNSVSSNIDICGNNSVVATTSQNQEQLKHRSTKNKKLACRLFTLIAAYGCCLSPSICTLLAILGFYIVRKVFGLNIDLSFANQETAFRIHLRTLCCAGLVLSLIHI